MSAPLDLSLLKDKVKSKLAAADKPAKKDKSAKKDKKDIKGKQDTLNRGKDNHHRGDKKNDKRPQSRGKQNNNKQSKPKDDKPHKTNDFKDKSDEKKALQDALRQEALAMGATEDDLNLIADVKDDDSEQEFDDEGKDANLEKELALMYQDIGFDGKIPEDLDDDEVPELVEGDDDEEEEEEEDDDEEEEEEEQPSKPTKKDGSDSKSATGLESESERAPPQPAKKKNADFIEDVRSVVLSKLQMPNRNDWYNLELAAPAGAATNPDKYTKERLYDRAKAFVDAENKLYYEEFTANSSQKKFLSQILVDGTLNDKISALALLAQEAPFHNIKAIDTLLQFCEKKLRTAALQAIAAFKDFMLGGVLPDRKLVAFNKQPLSDDLTDAQLGLMYFEDHLKLVYFKFIQVLEHLLHDPIVHVRTQVVSHIFELLLAKPEQEANLLRLGVNKLGDSDSKVALKTLHLLLTLEQAHPNMAPIVVGAVVDQVMKPGAEYSTQYYGSTTLNQTVLGREQIELANTLVKTYFALFEKVLVEAKEVEEKVDNILGKLENKRKNLRNTGKKGKKGGKLVKQIKSEAEVIEEKNQRLFLAVLTGLNRAFPFSNLPQDVYTKHLDILFKVTHSSNFNTSVQALLLIHHVVTRQDLDADRYYKTLYELLLDPRVATTSKQGIYLNLLYKLLKNDKVVGRQLAFVKRMLQVCVHWLNVGLVAGMIFVVMELAKQQPAIGDMLVDKQLRPEDTIKLAEEDEGQEYDPRKRDPKFAHAASSLLWEIEAFLKHYHPTVGVYAESLVKGTKQPKPDLGLFTLAHFLDRFVYKNAKEKTGPKGMSIMQPLGGGFNTKSTDQAPANTIDWLAKRADQVRPDEQFYHQYFTTKQLKLKGAVLKKKKKSGDDDDEEEDNEAEVWDALVRLRPEVEMDGEDDDMFDDEDLDFGDMLSDDDDDDVDATATANDLGAVVDDDDDDADEDDEQFYLAMMDQDSEEEGLDAEIDHPAAADDDDDDEDEKPRKRIKLSLLPTFALAEDYSQYLE
ncbi:hypothetical protein JNB11_04920 [Kocuria palustris]|nr:hypothetical protein [Kocuria palustris]